MNIVYALLPPLLVLPLIIGFGERYKNLRECSIILAGVILLLVNIKIYQDFIAGDLAANPELVFFQGLSLTLSAEPIGILFALLASFLWIVTTIYSIGYMRGHNEQHQTRFYACFAVAITSVMAAAYAGNLLTLFIAYEAITLSTFPLVTHAGTDKAKRAGRIYLGVLMGGSIALLMPAIIIIWWLTGSVDFVSGGVFLGLENAIDPVWIGVVLAMIVFGTGKAALMPFHQWLPNAMVAPTPVSALLHAVAVVKTGVFLIVKVVVYIFGFSILETIHADDILLVVASFTIITASCIAFTKDNLKARLAYSTISQLAYIVLAALLANTIAVQGAGLHIVTHAFGKITLFFCAGAIMVALHKTMISELDGIGKKMPLTMTAFFIAALSIIGLPPLAGVWSKLLIAQGALVADHIWVVGVLLLSSLLNIAYLLPIPIRAFFARASHVGSEVAVSEVTIKEAPLPCLIAITITSIACVLLFLWPDSVLQLLTNIE